MADTFLYMYFHPLLAWECFENARKNYVLVFTLLKQGCAGVRTLSSHHYDLGLIPRPGVTCLSLLLVLILALRVFLRVLCFFSFFNNQHFKFQFHLEIVKKKSHLACGLCNAKSLFLNFFYLFTRNELSHFT